MKKTKRLVIPITEQFHYALKMHATRIQMTMANYVTHALAEKMKRDAEITHGVDNKNLLHAVHEALLKLGSTHDK